MENEQDNFFKKVFYTGLGLTISTKEAIEKKVKELVDKNKISVEEGKKMIHDLTNKFEKNKDEVEKEMRDFVKRTAEKLNFAKKKDLEEINKRLDEIESKLDQLGTTKVE